MSGQVILSILQLAIVCFFPH